MEFGWLQRIWLLERIADRCIEMSLDSAYEFVAPKLWRAGKGERYQP